MIIIKNVKKIFKSGPLVPFDFKESQPEQTLPKLPDELLLKIFKLLTEGRTIQEATPDILNWSRVCKEFSRIAKNQPILKVARLCAQTITTAMTKLDKKNAGKKYGKGPISYAAALERAQDYKEQLTIDLHNTHTSLKAAQENVKGSASGSSYISAEELMFYDVERKYKQHAKDYKAANKLIFDLTTGLEQQATKLLHKK